MTENRYTEMLKEASDSLEYWTEAAILDLTEEIVRLMEEKGISRSELAQRVDASQAYITKILRGRTNFTIATMAKLARALDTVVRIHLAPHDAVVQWSDEMTTDLKSDLTLPFSQARPQYRIETFDISARTYDLPNPQGIQSESLRLANHV